MADIPIPDFEHTSPTDWTELRADLEALEGDEDAVSWLDADPSVAWDCDPETEPTYHGLLGALYLRAGWERCYHRDSARFHYNVKDNYGERWQAFRTVIGDREDRGNGFDSERAGTIATDREDMSREWWWGEDLPELVARAMWGDDSTHKGEDAWGCGRSGGYVNIPRLESNGTAMLKVAEALELERAYWNSATAGTELAAEVLEEYDAEALEELASPRECIGAW